MRAVPNYAIPTVVYVLLVTLVVWGRCTSWAVGTASGSTLRCPALCGNLLMYADGLAPRREGCVILLVAAGRGFALEFMRRRLLGGCDWWP